MSEVALDGITNLKMSTIFVGYNGFYLWIIVGKRFQEWLQSCGPEMIGNVDKN